MMPLTYMDTFRPESEAEHKRGNRGEDVPDYCANCHRPYLNHNNGECPVAGAVCGCGICVEPESPFPTFEELRERQGLPVYGRGTVINYGRGRGDER